MNLNVVVIGREVEDIVRDDLRHYLRHMVTYQNLSNNTDTPLIAADWFDAYRIANRIYERLQDDDPVKIEFKPKEVGKAFKKAMKLEKRLAQQYNTSERSA